MRRFPALDASRLAVAMTPEGASKKVNLTNSDQPVSQRAYFRTLPGVSGAPRFLRVVVSIARCLSATALRGAETPDIPFPAHAGTGPQGSPRGHPLLWRPLRSGSAATSRPILDARAEAIARAIRPAAPMGEQEGPVGKMPTSRRFQEAPPSRPDGRGGASEHGNDPLHCGYACNRSNKKSEIFFSAEQFHQLAMEAANSGNSCCHGGSPPWSIL